VSAKLCNDYPIKYYNKLACIKRLRVIIIIDSPGAKLDYKNTKFITSALAPYFIIILLHRPYFWKLFSNYESLWWVYGTRTYSETWHCYGALV